MLRLTVLFLYCSSMIGCLASNGDLDDHQWSCEESVDCGSGWQCDRSAGHCVPAYEQRNGVFDDRLLIGMSAALNDDVPGLAHVGRSTRDGILAYFSRVNRTGGIYGRRLELVVLNDSYDPAITQENVEELIGGDNREVFALKNILGTGPSLAARALAIKHKVLLFAPGSGFDGLEPDPPDRYVFNVRVRYSEEAEQLTQYLALTAEPPTPAENFAVFAQGDNDRGKADAFGASGVTGVARAVRDIGNIPESKLTVTTYCSATVCKRTEPIGESDVRNAVETLLKWMAAPERKADADGMIYIGIPMATLSDSAVALIKTLLDQVSKAARGETVVYGGFTPTEAELSQLAKVRVRFATLSTVGLDLNKRLKELGTYHTKEGREVVTHHYGEGTLFAMPVPDTGSNATGVLRYREDLAAFDDKLSPNPFSLESYINSWLLGEALRRHGRDITTESFIDTLETLKIDLGIGTTLAFTPNNHQANTKLWGASLTKDLELQPFDKPLTQ